MNSDRPRVALVTFGDGAPRFRRAARRLAREADATGWFAEIDPWDAQRLTNDLPRFATSHQRLLTQGSRGFGYWIWKPAILLEVLRESSADVVVFLDAGCVLNCTPSSTSRFDRYIGSTLERGILATTLDLAERRFTKRDLLDRLTMPEHLALSGQHQSGIVFFERSSASIDFCQKWLDLCEEDDHHFLDDSPSNQPESGEFVEHRHDQSIFSCLAKLHSIGAMADETYFERSWNTAGADFPIWAPRHKWGSPFPADGVPGIRLKLERRLLR